MERQTVVDAALSADETYAYLLVGDRAQARSAQVPRFVSESAYTEEIATPPRPKVGDAQDRRRLAILNLKTGAAVWAGLEGVSDPIVIPKPVENEDAAPPASPAPAPPKGTRDVRWGQPVLSPDETLAVSSVRADDNTDRWLVLIDPETGKTKVLDQTHDDAWVREIGPANNLGGGLGWLPDNRRVWFLAEHDGWMHLDTLDATQERPHANSSRPAASRSTR